MPKRKQVMCEGCGKAPIHPNGDWYYGENKKVRLCMSCANKVAKRFKKFVQTICEDNY